MQGDRFERQKYIENVAALGGGKAMVMTFGCQQNEADSDRLRGMLSQMGYVPTEDKAQANVILMNTCAVREHAELRVFGIIGALKALKNKNPNLVIGLCGCMMQQKNMAEEILKKYPQVDFVFGTHTLDDMPRLLCNAVAKKQRGFSLQDKEKPIDETLPVLRTSSFKADVTVMYGCNNFCTYCIVPYVRGRERSRSSDMIVNEVRELVNSGYKEILLLGQNVNSYGKDLEGECNFAGLLRKVSAIEGDFIIRFMTSHPKDATRELIDAMAECEKVERHLHLPLQSGSNRVLSAMNRRYTFESYKALLDYARERMPGLAVTTDLIVGFPTETEEEFEETLAAMKEVEFDSAYSFIYSRRKGTPAAEMAGQISKENKGSRMTRLLNLQTEIARRCNDRLVGTVQRVLVEGVSETNKDMLSAHTSSGKLVHFEGDKSLIGTFVNVTITQAKAFSLYAKI